MSVNLTSLRNDVVSWHTRAHPDAAAGDITLKLCSEAGEVADAVLLPAFGGKGDVAEECADVLICVLALLGRYHPDVDLLAVANRKLLLLRVRLDGVPLPEIAEPHWPHAEVSA